MSEVHSTNSTAPNKPSKPYPEFPLRGTTSATARRAARSALCSDQYHNFGITQEGKANDDPAYLPNDYTLFQVQPKHCDKWRAQTPHGAMQIALADGSVRSVAGNTSLSMWKHALKPRDEAERVNLPYSAIPVRKSWCQDLPDW